LGHCLRVVLAMPRPRPQAGEAEAMEQIVGAHQGVLDAELLFQNALNVPATEGTHTVGGARARF
jgi:hypothetical protein